MTRAKKGTSKSARITSQLFIKPLSLKAGPAAKPPSFDSLSVDITQCKKAVEALVAFVKRRIADKEQTDLLAGEENEEVWLGVTLKRMSPRDTHKPIPVPLPNPLMDPRKNPVCLLVKDPQREYKDLLEQKKIKFVSRVVGMEKLQGKFKPFEARRQLMKEHDLFLVDDRIVPEMPRVLGKSWLQAKKSPIPVTLKRLDLKAELERAISSTYIRLSKGTAVSVKLGSLSNHSPDQLYENLISVIPHMAIRMPLGGWDNVQALHIKTTTSVSLPVWTCSLGINDENAKDGRFFAPEVNQEEVEAKKKAKDEKRKRLVERKQERKQGASMKVDSAALSLTPSQDDNVTRSELEEIDETKATSFSPASKKVKLKSPKHTKSTSKTSGPDRKQVSSTGKKVKGIDTIKGLPRKPKTQPKSI